MVIHRVAFLCFMLVFAVLGYRLGSLHGSLMAQLCDRHREAWQRLGSPHAGWAGWTPRTLFFFAFGRYETLAIPLSQRLHVDSGLDFYFGFLAASLSQQCSGAGSSCELPRKPSNQSMKPTAPLQYNFSVFVTTPCRGLSLSR
jgi:hypothetical protein